MAAAPHNANPTGTYDVTHLRVEHYNGDVLGIGESQPRLSWIYTETPPEDAQLKVTVTRHVLGGETRTEETYLPTEPSVLVPWQFLPLTSMEEVRASVQLVTPNHEPLGAPSQTLRFETGILDFYDYWADFVGPSWAEPETDHRHLPLVRTEIDLGGKPARARLYMTACGVVEAEINGQRVGDDVLCPGWTVYDRRLECWTYDVTDQLIAGRNAMGFWLGDGWYRGRLGFDGGRANFYGDRIGVLAQLEIEYADGTRASVYSNSWDGTWKATSGPIVCSDLYEGEHYDARLEHPGWSQPGFDDSDWQPVAEVFYEPQHLECPELPPIRAHESNVPVSITRVDGTDMNDGTATWLIDFGQNCSQRMRVHMRGLNAGDTVTMRHAEVLEPDGTLATRTLRRGQQCDVYTSNGTDAWWEPRFTMHGFRYATIEGWRGELTADDIDCRVYHTDMERTGWFDSSNPLLNRLHDNALWSMRSNFLSIPTDCPQRDERLGWTGDIDLFAPTATYLYDTQGFLTNWLKDVRNEQKAWGTVPFYVPFVPLRVWAIPQAIAIWGDAAVAVPWALYMDGGDTRVLEKTYPLVTAWIDEVSGYLSDDGVWDREPQYCLGQLGDWLDPSAPPEDPALAMTEKTLVATAYFTRSCAHATAIAHALGRAQDEARFAALTAKVTQGFLDRFTNLDGTMTSDTQCAYALAIAFGLLDDEPVRKVKAGNRLAELVRESGGRVSTGFAGTPFVLPALSMTGHDQEAYGLLMSTECPSWLYQVTMGATTTWERWDSMCPDGTLNPGGMTSFNHYALGSVCEWLHSRIGGLQAIEPGWSKFAVCPQPGGGLNHASTSHLTPYGMASSAWSVDDDVLALDVTVPVGTTAEIRIAGVEPETLGAGTHHREYTL